jgi:hypothetical protein
MKKVRINLKDLDQALLKQCCIKVERLENLTGIIEIEGESVDDCKPIVNQKKDDCKQENLPCPHGRAHYSHCPHCMGMNDAKFTPKEDKSPCCNAPWAKSVSTLKGTRTICNACGKERCKCACHVPILGGPYKHDTKCCDDMNGYIPEETPRVEKLNFHHSRLVNFDIKYKINELVDHINTLYSQLNKPNK